MTKKYIIGIDTGGTFTDAALLEITSGQVLQTAKVPTTHHRLSEGTAKVIHAIFHASNLSADDIEGVAISSTLATNSVVENRGARVALLVIGYVKHFKLPVKAVIFIKGGHTITGAEEEPLELDYLVSLLHNLKEEVDAYGICSAMSFINPAHELVAEKAIAMVDPKPVFCSHRVSQQAGMEERAATAGLHAKLMPLMQQYIGGVKSALKAHGLTCPMHIIGGNGLPISAEKAIEHAGMTVASGPACTAIFGACHTDSDALIIDVGGTTTDIAMIRNGQPAFAEEGCQIGRWKTHVQAIDMYTKGIGGDSHVRIDDNSNMHVGPGRVVPLAISSNPADIASWLGQGSRSKLIDSVKPENQPGNPDPIIEILRQNGALSPAELQNIWQRGSIALEKQLELLSHQQRISETGFTPTDALHVLGKISFGDAAKSRKAAEILGKIKGIGAIEFSQIVVGKTIEMIEDVILEYLTQHFWKKSLVNFISTRNSHPVLGVDFSIKVPLIGIGAAAKYFLPEVAHRLKTTVHFPENYEVGNAIGAALICRKERQL